MPLAQEDLDLIKQQVGDYVKDHISDWLAEKSLGKPPVVYEIELRERMVRVEEELKHQRELMREGFARMDERFAAMSQEMDKRFEQVEKRFEQVEKRFEQVDKRFDEMLKRHDTQFLWLIGFITTGVFILIGAMRYL